MIEPAMSAMIKKVMHKLLELDLADDPLDARNLVIEFILQLVDVGLEKLENTTKRRAVLAELTKQAQELDMGY